jgi:hypothetical protein
MDDDDEYHANTHDVDEFRFRHMCLTVAWKMLNISEGGFVIWLS